MPDPRSGAPLLTVGQAGKELTVNEAISTLSALSVGSAIAQQNAPPVNPVEGDLYIVGAAPTGAWATRNNQLVVSRANSPGGWKFFSPQLGWRTPLLSLGGKVVYWDGAVWAPAEPIGYVESQSVATTAIALVTGTNIPLPNIPGLGGVDIATGKVTHPTGRFSVNLFCALTGVASGTTGSVVLWIKAGAYERMVGIMTFPATPGEKRSVSTSIEITADAADPIELIIKDPIGLTSLNQDTLWIQIREQ